MSLCLAIFNEKHARRLGLGTGQLTVEPIIRGETRPSALTIMTLEVPPSYSVSSVIQDKSVCASLSLSRVLRVVAAADMSGWASL